MISSKFAITSLIGTGVVGFSSPVTYAVITQPFHKTLWRKTLEKTNAVINCSSSLGKQYDLQLDLAEDDNEDFGYGISFKAWGDKEESRGGGDQWKGKKRFELNKRK